MNLVQGGLEVLGEILLTQLMSSLEGGALSGAQDLILVGGLVALLRVKGLDDLLGGDLLVAPLASDGLLLLFLLIL